MDTSRLGTWIGAAAALHALLSLVIFWSPEVSAPGAAVEAELVWLDEAAENSGASSEGLEEPEERATAEQPQDVTARAPSGAFLRRSATVDRTAATGDAATAALTSHAAPPSSSGEVQSDDAALPNGEGAPAVAAAGAEKGNRRSSLTSAAGRRRAGGAGAGRIDASQAHGPRLRSRLDPCRGMFPRGAEHDRGSVVVSLRVDPTGIATEPRVLRESPRSEGFAEAARACAGRIRFEPAADERGRPIASESVLRLHFHRG